MVAGVAGFAAAAARGPNVRQRTFPPWKLLGWKELPCWRQRSHLPAQGEVESCRERTEDTRELLPVMLAPVAAAVVAAEKQT